MWVSRALALPEVNQIHPTVKQTRLHDSGTYKEGTTNSGLLFRNVRMQTKTGHQNWNTPVAPVKHSVPKKDGVLPKENLFYPVEDNYIFFKHTDFCQS